MEKARHSCTFCSWHLRKTCYWHRKFMSIHGIPCDQFINWRGEEGYLLWEKIAKATQTDIV